MGTINYRTSDYITLGFNCSNIEYEDEFYRDIICDLYDQIKHRLEEERFYYFNITVEPGYYEGYFINIENNFPVAFDSYREKTEAQKEITAIKQFLIECINDFECVAVYPGWCTGYAGHKNTMKELSAAVTEMRTEVQTTPTWAQYERGIRV